MLLLIALTAHAFVIYAQGLSADAQARLQNVLENFQSNPANPYVGGISAAITIDGLASWQGATGYAARNVDADNNLQSGGTSFTTAHLSRAYSVTKSFTAALVLELAKEGALALGSKVSEFLPLSSINPRLNQDVTVAQLLAHESGYSDFLTDISFQVAVAFQPTRTWNPFETISFANQLQEPGSVRKYSSTNYIMLGAIVEAATGKPIAEHFRERFFKPLQLSSMYLAGREPAVPGTLAVPHDNISALNPIFYVTGQPLFPDAFTNISRFPFTAIESVAFTSGGIVSTAADLATWGNALFTGKATSATTLSRMMESIAATPDEDGDFLGYGIWRSTKISASDEFFGHDGSATGYRSVMFYQPQKKLTIAIMTNYAGAALYDVAKALYEALPEFTCGNKKDEQVLVCWNGKAHCVARAAAANLIDKGAWLGGCATAPAAFRKSLQTRENAAAVAPMVTATPNPVRGNTSISFKAAADGQVVLELFDVNGKRIAGLFQGWLRKNQVRQLTLRPDKLQAGVYLLRMATASGIGQQKIIVTQ